jgi:hypothetical protein
LASGRKRSDWGSYYIGKRNSVLLESKEENPKRKMSVIEVRFRFESSA